MPGLEGSCLVESWPMVTRKQSLWDLEKQVLLHPWEELGSNIPPTLRRLSGEGFRSLGVDS